MSDIPLPSAHEDSPTEESLAFYRASGECICETCGKTYYRHPMGGPFTESMGYERRQWLHRLCNGDLVKL